MQGGYQRDFQFLARVIEYSEGYACVLAVLPHFLILGTLLLVGWCYGLILGPHTCKGDSFTAELHIIVLWISFSLPGPLTLPSWEETSQVPRLPPPVHKTKVPFAMASSLFRAHELPSTRSQGNGPGGGSPEKGKLLMVYREREKGKA